MTKRPLFTGINLGGWLILEKWQTPSVFKGTSASDEWELSRTDEGKRRIRQHRKTFITEDDFKWLAAHKVNFVRLPVPYWALVKTDEYVFAGKELEWAMKMAKKYGIKVLLDLHALPGGQNIGDHSGKQGQMDWFDDATYQTQTIAILKNMAQKYRDSPALWGIEIMNEPEVKGHMWQLIRFYRLAYRELRSVLKPGKYTVFHDGFQPLLFTGALWRRRGYPVAIDVHWYAFTYRSRASLTEYKRFSQALRRSLLAILRLWQPVIVGEWSSVLPQRYFDQAPQARHKALLVENITEQRRTYNRALGHTYWNYKAEGDGMWNFRSLVEIDNLPLE